MNELKMKAKAGVTLVELLVVILIVTILSVSMLPLLQPFVTEAQYAAEAIPVIGNLRTKIGLYMYDKGELPMSLDDTYVFTWKEGVDVTPQGAAQATTDTELFGPAWYAIANSSGQTVTQCSAPIPNQNPVAGEITEHFGQKIDVNYQDLKGKRSKPSQYHYYCLNKATGSYVVGCFGDGSLKKGTGYAVCELNFPTIKKKYIGTWKCYKPVDDTVAIQFANQAWNNKDVSYCFIPSAQDLAGTYKPNAGSTGRPTIIGAMEAMGWEF